ncbi:MAG: hypothetical protein KGI97_06880, partial [Alphaproteobacteria bacterium]|nr:hypothetical protein [Alphaproteobacteria bacterium]
GAQNISSILVNSGVATPDMVGSCAGTRWGASWGGTSGCILNPWNDQIIVGSQYGWAGFPSKTNRFEMQIDESKFAVPCAALLGSLVPQAAAAGLVEYYDGSTTSTASTSAAASTYAGCNGGNYLGLQFQL